MFLSIIIYNAFIDIQKFFFFYVFENLLFDQKYSKKYLRITQ